MKRNLPRFIKPKSSKGFTLIELLVVIGILAILLSIVLIAINPGRQFGQANDTKRRSAVTQILNAVGAYAAENKGQLPTGITTTNAEIGNGAGQADLCSILVPNYIPALPVDPSITGAEDISDCAQVGGYATGYEIVQDATAAGRVTVTAPNSEITTPITITR